MTRVLSELLGTREPHFSQSLRQLESLSGHPRADIRLTNKLQIEQAGKLRELGLDAHDTTGRELYVAIGARLKDDNMRFEKVIGVLPDDEAGRNALIAQALLAHIDSRHSFAIRSTAAKRMLLAQLPKRTMKALGYRSADSMLKHETPASLMAAALALESDAWARRFRAGYSKLTASDFENRRLTVEYPHSRRWLGLMEHMTSGNRRTVIAVKELGSVVLLPVHDSKMPLASLTTAVLTLQAINEVRAAGTFMKLHQMESNFGSIVQQVVLGEPMLPAEAWDRPVSWHNLHQFFARVEASARTTMFEPVVAAEELAWANIEQVLAKIAPALGFWEHTAHLALHNATVGSVRPVSFNLTDSLLSHSNALPYEQRIIQYFQKSLQSELLLSYLNHDKLEQTFFAGVHRKLAPEMAI